VRDLNMDSSPRLAGPVAVIPFGTSRPGPVTAEAGDANEPAHREAPWWSRQGRGAGGRAGRGEKISALAAPGSETSVGLGRLGGRIIDASEPVRVCRAPRRCTPKWRWPFGGTFWWETFETGDPGRGVAGHHCIVDF